ncbi:MAG TPA: hypothetical protein VLB90_01380 [Pseudomonadales bacterium]|nr:hypothetical protein [Pseudomonadales bacterium]
MAMVLVCLMSDAQADEQKLGVYNGTVSIMGAKLGEYIQTRFSAEVKTRLPITNRKKTSAMAELDDVKTPSSTALIKQWSVTGKNSMPDSDGKISTWTCEIAEPTEVPMNGTGTLDLNYATSKYKMFIALVALKPIPLRCVNSRSGPYQDETFANLFFGTGEPVFFHSIELPFQNASDIKATYQLVPIHELKGQYSPVDMTWNLQLQPE